MNTTDPTFDPDKADQPAPADAPLSFEKVGDAKYRLALVSAADRPFGLLVKKDSVMNPSARGGAYKDEWVAYNGGLYVKERGATRIEATRKALAVLAKRGIVPALTAAPSEDDDQHG